MIYTAPDGIHVLDMATMKTKLLVANPPQRGWRCGRAGRGTVHALVVGHKANSIFYTKDGRSRRNAVYKADTNTGAVRKLVDLPAKRNIVSVNADETWRRAPTTRSRNRKEYGSNLPSAAPAAGLHPAAGPRTTACNAAQGRTTSRPHKGAMMETRLAARIPLVLFTIRLEPGLTGKSRARRRSCCTRPTG